MAGISKQLRNQIYRLLYVPDGIHASAERGTGVQQFRILLDLDGTVLQNAGRQMLIEQFGLTLAEDESAPESLERLGIDSGQFWAWWSANQVEIYGRAVALEGAVAVIRSLRQAGAFVAVVTARRSEAEDVTRSWIDQAGLEVDEMVFGADDKVSVALSLGLNLAFEDNVQNAEALSAHMPVVLMSGRHNAAADLLPGIFKVEEWSRVPALLEELSRRTA